jgi:hypothetical protein
MTTPAPDRDTAASPRISALTAVLEDATQKQAVDSALRDAGGDFGQARAQLEANLPPTAIKKLALANTLAEWSDNNVNLVSTLTADPDVESLRDVAARYNVTDLAKLLAPQVTDTAAAPAATAAGTVREQAVQLRRGLYTAEPSAVVQKMLTDNELPLGDGAVGSGMAAFLANQPDFDLRTTSIYGALAHPQAFDRIDADTQPIVTDGLKTLQCIAAISHVPEAIPAVLHTRLRSAFDVAQVPESTFLRALGPALGDDAARQVYTNALNADIRNEAALATIRDTIRGSGPAVIDGATTRDDRIAAFQAAVSRQGSEPISFRGSAIAQLSSRSSRVTHNRGPRGWRNSSSGAGSTKSQCWIDPETTI